MTRRAQQPADDRDAPPSSAGGQSFPAASPLDDWSRFVAELATRQGEVEESGSFSSFRAALADLSEPPPPPPPVPPSEKTRIGPFGSSTERKIRTLDPREPSIEATRLDLFTVPRPADVAAAEPASDQREQPEQPEPRVPPSYRTRVGLYFVPQEPATEPSLPEDLLDSITRRAPRPSLWARIVRLFKR